MLASASAGRTRIRPARGWARVPGWRSAGRRWPAKAGGRIHGGGAGAGTATTGATAAGAVDGGWGARRNHPAGGATPGQDWSPAAGSATAGPRRLALRQPSPRQPSRDGWPCDSRLGAGRGWRGIGFGLARTRNHQARRHGPGRHEIFRIIPAKQAGALPLFLARDAMMTILTRLVTFCIHHRPQSRHISGKYRSVPILALSGSYGITRGSMLPIESERVQRAIFVRARPMPRLARNLTAGGCDLVGTGGQRLARSGARRVTAGGSRSPGSGSDRTRWPGRWSASGRGARRRGSHPPHGR